jgi:putative hemolysin
MSAVVFAVVSNTDIWMMVAIFVLLIVLAFLGLAEMGLSRTSRHKAQALAESGSPAGRSLLRLVGTPERFVNPVLLVVNVCQTVQATLTGIVADRAFGVVGLVVGVTLNVVVFFVIAESVPKTWAILHPDQAALASARPVSALVAFPPLQLVSRGLIGLTNVIIPGKGLKQGPFMSEVELLATIEAAAADETIEHEERRLIESIIEFGDTVAREIMVPRPDMITVAGDASVTEALDLAIQHGYSRMPVVGENRDDVLGIAYSKDLVRVERSGSGGHVVDVVRPAMFVPETKPVSRLMREMQATKQHMAVLVDEYGGVAGLVTLEDCIEELVGDIVDEYDVEGPEVETLPDGHWRVDASMSIDDLSELLTRDLPDEDWDTAGGFVFASLGHVPEVGEAIDVEGFHLVVDAMDGRRISRLQISPIPGWEPPVDEHGND